MAIKSGINRAIFHVEEWGSAKQEVARVVSLPREVSGNQVNEERGATSRKRRARKRRDEGGPFT